MRRFFSFLFSYFLLIIFAYAEGVTKYVNPFMGTTTLWTPEDLGYIRTEEKRPWGAETFPGAALPNAMVQLTPVTMYRSGSGYQYEDNMIYGFAHTSKGHWNLLHLPILPVTKEGKPTPAGYRSLFRHTEEEAHPGYYRVFLDRYKVNVELTSTLHCGYHGYTYREGDERQRAHLLRARRRLGPRASREGQAELRHRPSRGEPDRGRLAVRDAAWLGKRARRLD